MSTIPFDPSKLQNAGRVTPLEAPHSVETEQSTLGGLMLDNRSWPAVSKIVSERDFFEEKHQFIFEAIRGLAEKGHPFDVVTLATALEDAGQIEAVGNWAYLGRLARDTPSAANVTGYARIVRRKALERRRLAALAKGDHHQAAALTATIDALEASSQAVPLLPTIDTILARNIVHDWLVEGWIERRQIAVLFGDSQACKSLLAIDIGCCVASEMAWRGHETQKGAVLYVVGEGAGGGITRRFTAWQMANQKPLAGRPLFFQETTTTLPDDLDRLITEIRRTLEFYGWKLELVILDTLSRTISGDERSSADFAKYQRALDQLRQEFDCAVLYLHHTGHADKSRERGVSEIGCNADVRMQIEIVGEETRRLRALKVKDADTPPDLFFALSPVDLGQMDSKGKPITSVVLRHLQDCQPTAAAPMNRYERLVCTILKEQGPMLVGDCRKAFQDSLRKNELGKKYDALRMAWNRAKGALLDKELLIEQDGIVRLPEQTEPNTEPNRTPNTAPNSEQIDEQAKLSNKESLPEQTEQNRTCSLCSLDKPDTEPNEHEHPPIGVFGCSVCSESEQAQSASENFEQDNTASLAHGDKAANPANGDKRDMSPQCSLISPGKGGGDKGDTSLKECFPVSISRGDKGDMSPPCPPLSPDLSQGGQGDKGDTLLKECPPVPPPVPVPNESVVVSEDIAPSPVADAWADKEGTPIHSAVLTSCELPVAAPKPTITPMGTNQAKALELLRHLCQRNRTHWPASGLDRGTARVTRQDWYRALKRAGFPKNRRTDVRNNLLQRGLIGVVGDCVYLTGGAADYE